MKLTNIMHSIIIQSEILGHTRKPVRENVENKLLKSTSQSCSLFSNVMCPRIQTMNS